MPKLSELKPVEQQVTQWLSRMGWELRTPEEMKAYSRPLGNPVVEKILRAKVAELTNELMNAMIKFYSIN